MRLPHRPADRLPHDLRGTRLSRRDNSDELALGAALVIVTAIAAEEMAHLVHPTLALLAMATCLAGVFWAYR